MGVYSNSGGIKFPDHTIQQTAAYSSSVKGASDDRLFIVMELSIDGNEIQGPYNENGYYDDCRVIDWAMGFERPFDLTGFVQNGPITVIKDIDEGSPEIMKDLFDNNNCLVVLHLLYDNQGAIDEVYKITLSQARIIKCENILVYKGNNNFAQLETVSFLPSQVTLKHISPGKQYSFTFGTPN